MSIIPQLEPIEPVVQLTHLCPKEPTEEPRRFYSCLDLGEMASAKNVDIQGSAIDALFAVGPHLSSLASNITLPSDREELMSIY
jgi:hypothetical protein